MEIIFTLIPPLRASALPEAWPLPNIWLLKGDIMDKKCAPPKLKDRQIQNEIVILAGNMETLTAKIAVLDSRLTPALRPEPPSEPDDAKELENILVMFATDIRQVRYSIEAQTTVLDSILDRLEM